MPRQRRALAAKDSNIESNVAMNEAPKGSRVTPSSIKNEEEVSVVPVRKIRRRVKKKSADAQGEKQAENELMNTRTADVESVPVAALERTQEMQEQHGEPDDQKAELEKQKAENDRLRAEIASLTDMLSKASIKQEATSRESTTANPFGGALPVRSMPTLFPPKRPLSAFQFFASATRAGFKAENPQVPPRQVGQELEKIWDASDDKLKAPFEEVALQDKLRYEQEKEEYQQSKSEAERRRLAVEWVQQEKKTAMALEFYEREMGKVAPKGSPSGKPKDDVALPKRPLSAWNFFLKACHAKALDQATKAGGTSTAVSMAELTSQRAGEWKRLQASRKKADKKALEGYKKMAEEDKKRYQEEMRAYNAKVSERHKSDQLQSLAFEEEALRSYAVKESQDMLIQEGKQAQAVARNLVKEEKKEAREAKIAAREAKAARPKGARSAYNFFVQVMLPEIREKDGTDAKVAMAEVSRLWKEISDEERQEFTALAEEDRARYESEKQAAAAKTEMCDEQEGAEENGPEASF